MEWPKYNKLYFLVKFWILSNSCPRNISLDLARSIFNKIKQDDIFQVIVRCPRLNKISCDSIENGLAINVVSNEILLHIIIVKMPSFRMYWESEHIMSQSLVSNCLSLLGNKFSPDSSAYFSTFCTSSCTFVYKFVSNLIKNIIDTKDLV